LATKRGELYVVSGVIFAGTAIKRLNKRVFIPTSYFKAIYDPKTGDSGAYLVPNDASNDYKTVSINELVKVAGIEPFPTVSASSKAKAMTLPTVGAK
jgi:endonuclease G